MHGLSVASSAFGTSEIALERSRGCKPDDGWQGMPAWQESVYVVIPYVRVNDTVLFCNGLRRDATWNLASSFEYL